MEKQYISLKEAAEMLEVTPQTIRLWAQAGKLLSMKTLGGNYRILKEDVQRIVKQREK